MSIDVKEDVVTWMWYVFVEPTVHLVYWGIVDGKETGAGLITLLVESIMFIT